MHALNIEIVELIIDKLKEWHVSTNVPRVVFMQGSGQKAFWAGGDIRSVYDAAVNGINPDTPQELIIKEYIAEYNMSIAKPILIPVWNGIVMGAGVGMLKISAKFTNFENQQI